MANKSSTAITNRDAADRTVTNSNLVNAICHEGLGEIQITSSDASDSQLRFCSVPSNARISQILLSNSDSGTAGAIDVGIYKSTQDGSTVVDADFFASAQVLTTALSNEDITHESGEFAVSDAELPLWEALGLSSDPGIMYDIVATVTAAVVDDTNIAIKAKYVI